MFANDQILIPGRQDKLQHSIYNLDCTDKMYNLKMSNKKESYGVQGQVSGYS
jgi:hypothetical protein